MCLTEVIIRKPPQATQAAERLKRRRATLSLLLLFILFSMASGGCVRLRCGAATLGASHCETRHSEAMDEPLHATDDASAGEEWTEPEVERPIPRFHPVPAWDVFHPPTDLSYDSSMSDRSCRPFYLAPPVMR